MEVVKSIEKEQSTVKTVVTKNGKSQKKRDLWNKKLTKIKAIQNG